MYFIHTYSTSNNQNNGVLSGTTLKRPSSGMSFNRVMNDHAKVPMSGFVGNSLDLTSPPAFYLQGREWNLSRRNFLFCSTFILMIMFNWLLMNHL